MQSNCLEWLNIKITLLLVTGYGICFFISTVIEQFRVSTFLDIHLGDLFFYIFIELLFWYGIGV